MLTIGDEFFPRIVDCLQISLVDRVPSLSNLTGIYEAQTTWASNVPASAISLLIIACPRCQLLFTEGDEDAEFDPEDSDEWLDEDCIACEGSGEWAYEPI